MSPRARKSPRSFQRYAQANYRGSAKAVFMRLAKEVCPSHDEWFALGMVLFSLARKRGRRRSS
jgi:hypothetical protein